MSLLTTYTIHVHVYGGLMVNGVHDSGTSGLRSSPGEGHCDVFLGEALYSHSACLYRGI